MNQFEKAPTADDRICDLCRKKKPTNLALHNATNGTIQVCADPGCRELVTMPSVPLALKRHRLGSSY